MALPVGDGKPGRGSPGPEYAPVVVHPEGRAVSELGEVLGDLVPAERRERVVRARQRVGILDLDGHCVPLFARPARDQVPVVAGEQCHRIQPARLEIPDLL